MLTCPRHCPCPPSLSCRRRRRPKWPWPGSACTPASRGPGPRHTYPSHHPTHSRSMFRSNLEKNNLCVTCNISLNVFTRMRPHQCRSYSGHTRSLHCLSRSHPRPCTCPPAPGCCPRQCCTRTGRLNFNIRGHDDILIPASPCFWSH